jgi:hypothetical protein
MGPWKHKQKGAESEDHLRLAVEQALSEFNRTKAERDRLSAISADVADTPDGAMAVRNATRLHLQSVRHLKTALRSLRASEALNRNQNPLGYGSTHDGDGHS